MSKYVLEVLFSFGDGESFDCFSGLVGVFIMYPEVSCGRSGDYVMVVLPLEVAGFLEYVVFPIIFINYYFNIILAINANEGFSLLLASTETTILYLYQLDGVKLTSIDL